MKIPIWLGLGLLFIVAGGFGAVIYTQNKSTPDTVVQTVATTTVATTSAKEAVISKPASIKQPVQAVDSSKYQMTEAMQAPPPVPGNYYPQVSARVQSLLSLNASFASWLTTRDNQLNDIIVNLRYSSDPLANLKIQKANALKQIVSGLQDRTQKEISKWQQINSVLEQTKTRVPGGYATEAIYEEVPSPDFLQSDIISVKAQMNSDISSL